MRIIIIITLLVVNSCWVFGQETPNFQYELKRDSFNTEYIAVNAKIINNSDSSIFFLSTSCGGLEEYIETNIKKVGVLTLRYCNISYPRKIEIKPNSEYTFSTLILDQKKSEKLKLSLTFIQLSSTTKIEEKSIGQLEIENQDTTIKLKGKLVKVK